MQETLARAWKSWDELRDVALAKAWLVTIMRNELARSFSRNRTTVDIEAVGEAELPALPSFESQLETAELVSLLPESYREPLLLQVLGGFTCDEIAAMMELSTGAVMTRLSRARLALRKQPGLGDSDEAAA